MLTSAKLLFAGCVILVFLVQQNHTCHAISNNSCPSSSCGHISNIDYPFRLKTDSANCGRKEYELACENNVPVVYLSSAKYYVKEINYKNFTIRLAYFDVQNDDYCSLPPYPSTTRNSFSSSYDSYVESYKDYLYQDLVFVTCPKPVISEVYVDTSPCNIIYNSSSSSPNLEMKGYVKVGSDDAMDLKDSCRIERIYITSLLPKDAKNVSYADVHRSLAYGFELSWFLGGCCLDNSENLCKLDAATIIRSCHSTTGRPSNLRPLLVKLEESALGRLLRRLKWQPALYADLDFKGCVLALLHYVVLLFVLYRGPLFLGGVIWTILFFINRWRRRHLSEYGIVEEFLQSHNNLMPVRYTYSDIKKITNCFKYKLGEGGYGSVYKGKLRSGYFAAIKMLGKSKANGQEFINEVATIGRIHHVNIVRLIGFCVEGSKRALIYEFMPNGSLDKYIFSHDVGTTISIEKMYDISLGVARGIEYLHRGCNMQILHFDIKPHNILLDENFIPKVSDFGLAKLYPTDNSIVSLTAARGTLGYMAPELIYKSIGSISYKADVYSFGKLLMEMAGRRKNFNASDEHWSQIYYPSWVYDQFNEGKDIEIGDATEEERKITKKMIVVALWCIQLKPSDRPSMNKVVEMLESEIECIEMPPKPTFYPQEMPKEDFEIKASKELTNIPQSYLNSISWMLNGR
ncbi:LEAF RUST 10 DISEASE-RESISTANCE LOCUS RECEPTOR-LIKE PROTEIN KINASE-like 2.4 isoform X2 [Hevea brasiliensis]|uniref:LEAF RUST 10 DISEASE-RESISTANCE LOCUS RECEPTOR-LIKE PROTEIN KINASE-like 2.4 isoform X2 n=1 Tax=Hevea brasiliensis TaxID=3981 RepID=UPI0025D5B155|nr:LEAF RUST 10 DISEASE-RESISTANCE LOCUS RECEPTOR-LIKE PROTEIN KINASE-like 2.4 isoform X2 [Hevea brasiliensis]